jgi:hypothetical protein
MRLLPTLKGNNLKDNTLKNEIIIYEGGGSKPQIEVRLAGETVWLSQKQMAELFGCSVDNIALHLKNIYYEGELEETSTSEDSSAVQKEGSRQVLRKIRLYNLDAIISVGYRVNSLTGTKFRIWATQRLKEYIVKGFAIDSDRLKNLGGGNYWKELLDEIRDIRSSEKVLYRQVLDLYATAIDYDPKASESLRFFQIVQNKIHFAAHGHTASEVIYLRVDSDKPFAGLTNFKGSQPTQAEAMIAKNYLELKELKVLGNLVSAYFDIAELNAIEHKPMRMADYIDELDSILKTTGRKLLGDAGSVSHQQAERKAKAEYRKYKAKTLSNVEISYLESLKQIEKQIKRGKK